MADRTRVLGRRAVWGTRETIVTGDSRCATLRLADVALLWLAADAALVLGPAGVRGVCRCNLCWVHPDDPAESRGTRGVPHPTRDAQLQVSTAPGSLIGLRAP
jgi:hypothetical protein